MQAAPITVRQAAAKTSNHIKTTDALKPKSENFRLGAANKNGSLKTNNTTDCNLYCGKADDIKQNGESR